MIFSNREEFQMRRTNPTTIRIKLDMEEMLNETVARCAEVGIATHGLKSLIFNRGVFLACNEYLGKVKKLK